MGSSPAVPQGVVLQERDFALLRGLFECRVMRLAQASALYFEGCGENAKKRIQKLKKAGLVGELPRAQFGPSILTLRPAGLRSLQDTGVLSEYPPFSLPALERRAKVSERTLAHELDVIEIKAAFHQAVRDVPEATIKEFTTWPILHEFSTFGIHGEPVDVQPDGFLCIHRTEGDELDEYSYFVELDRSTESQGYLERKARYYRTYYTSGGFAERNGATRGDFAAHPFRVLVILQNKERRNNLAARLLSSRSPILTHVWLSTLNDVKKTPFGEIWMRPLDYRQAITGTAFDKEMLTDGVWRRSAERDRHVAGKAILHHLFE